MAILKIKDQDGNVYEVLAIRGEKGERGERGVDAYAKVVECGYEGSEEEFYLAMSRNGQAPDKTLSVNGACADARATGDAIDSKAETETYIVTIETNWVADGKYYIQDIGVPGILETDNPIPGVAYGKDDEANELYDECFDKVSRIITSANSIRVRAKEAISTAFPLQLKVVR